jgi:UDP-N-acetylglucosamine diphosphorylase / glucose-1-phosphate thymidylyltransferase / UDP-N-acetylgalactosamine diphosphorylase / glucosamine-1-phosphate N-acetyltransferase / galactosamine-1-phosphate N-acetyltransferase
MLKAEDFFDLAGSPFQSLFNDTEYAWDALKKLKGYIADRLEPNVKAIRNGNTVVEKTYIFYNGEALSSGFTLDSSGKKMKVTMDGSVLEGASVIYAGAFLMDDQIYIGRNSVIEPSALIKGPTYIGNNTEVRHGAYIRGDVLIGNGCVVGHATEIKSSVMVGGSKAGHFAYIGDSILGRVNLGAGTKLANLKMIDSPVTVKINSDAYDTGLRKFGAIIGDGAETGCNSVTTPGTLLAKGVLLYPNGTARGYYPPGTIVKVLQDQERLPLFQRDN